MALVKTSRLAGKRRGKVQPAPASAPPVSKPAATRARTSAPQSVAERLGAATEQFATGVAEASKAAE
jgi:methyl-accepting chemotaxis protein